MRNRFIVCTMLALLALTPQSPADATAQGVNSGGHPFLIGGIGRDEAELLASERSHFALTVRTAAAGSGAYLSDVHLSIRDAAGELVFDATLDGPWLLIDLPPGRYVVAGVQDGQVQQREVTLQAGAHRECVLYFTVEGELRPFHGDDTD